tara:strand:+ start:2224 stop:2703 length:480 start_codon:yes stop_codon:yes gene_type:complete
MLIWILGKSKSGKTFFAKKIVRYLEKKKIKCFHIDGDDFRKFISYDLGYDIKSRRKNGLRVFDFCKYLISKKYVVVLSMQSALRDMQKNNKKKFKEYIQINLSRKNVNMDKFTNKTKNVLGRDLKFNPIAGNLNLENNKKDTNKNYLLIIKYISKKIKK